MHMRVFYNTDPAAMMRGYQDGDKLRYETSFATAKDVDFGYEGHRLACDIVFRKMNVVDGDELPTRLKIRSMSVGDVIECIEPAEVTYGDDDYGYDSYGGSHITRYAVESTGWKVIGHTLE